MCPCFVVLVGGLFVSDADGLAAEQAQVGGKPAPKPLPFADVWPTFVKAELSVLCDPTGAWAPHFSTLSGPTAQAVRRDCGCGP